MGNAREKDDIDLIMIVKSRTLWASRLLATALVEMLGIRRRPGEQQVKNKICLNMFLAKNYLRLPPDERDFYGAHELLQMKPLWQREDSYKQFLRANRWVKSFFPDAWSDKISEREFSLPTMKSSYFSLGVYPVTFILRFFEWPAKIIQLKYMQRHRTSEVVTDGVLRFHPRDARPWVKRAFAARLARYKLPLDKIFYGR